MRTLDIPDVPPLTPEQAVMIQRDMQLSRHLEDLTLSDDDRLALIDQKLTLERQLQASRDRSWNAWWRDSGRQEQIDRMVGR